MEGYTKCKVCGKALKVINAAHLKAHKMTAKEYNKKYKSKANYLLKILKKSILAIIIFFKDFIKDIFMDQIKPFFKSCFAKMRKIFGYLGGVKIKLIIAVIGISIVSSAIIFKLNQDKLTLSITQPRLEFPIKNHNVHIPDDRNIDTVKNVFPEFLRPSRPEVPIESEEENIPDSVALDTTKIVFLEVPPPPPPPVEDEAAHLFFVSYDAPPEPIGGFKAIQKNIVYPEKAKKEQIEGQVTVYVLISEKGEALATRILVPLGNSGCNEAAIAAIKAVKWKPAKQKGRPVAAWLSIPVRFKL